MKKAERRKKAEKADSVVQLAFWQKLCQKERQATGSLPVPELSKVEAMSCTNDGGSSSGAKSFVDVNVHYVTEDFQPKKKILDVFEMKDSKTAENYRARVEDVHRQLKTR